MTTGQLLAETLTSETGINTALGHTQVRHGLTSNPNLRANQFSALCKALHMTSANQTSLLLSLSPVVRDELLKKVKSSVVTNQLLASGFLNEEQTAFLVEKVISGEIKISKALSSTIGAVALDLVPVAVTDNWVNSKTASIQTCMLFATRKNSGVDLDIIEQMIKDSVTAKAKGGVKTYATMPKVNKVVLAQFAQKSPEHSLVLLRTNVRTWAVGGSPWLDNEAELAKVVAGDPEACKKAGVEYRICPEDINDRLRWVEEHKATLMAFMANPYIPLDTRDWLCHKLREIDATPWSNQVTDWDRRDDLRSVFNLARNTLFGGPANLDRKLQQALPSTRGEFDRLGRVLRILNDPRLDLAAISERSLSESFCMLNYTNVMDPVEQIRQLAIWTSEFFQSRNILVSDDSWAFINSIIDNGLCQTYRSGRLAASETPSKVRSGSLPDQDVCDVKVGHSLSWSEYQGYYPRYGLSSSLVSEIETTLGEKPSAWAQFFDLVDVWDGTWRELLDVIIANQ